MSGDQQGSRTTASVIAIDLAVEQAVKDAVLAYLEHNKGRAEIAGSAGTSVAAQKAAASILEPEGFNLIKAEVGPVMNLMPLRACIVTWRVVEERRDDDGKKITVVVDLGGMLFTVIEC